MNSNAKKELIDLQKSLYDKAYEDAHFYAKGSSKVLLAYSNRFEHSLPDQFTSSNHEHIISQITRSDIVLFGDFHTLKQSQRGLLRILRSLIHHKRKSPDIVLALEAFKAKDQKHLDSYLNSDINDEKLLEATNYKVDWGFPWANYKVLLDFAKEHQIEVIGINSPNSGQDSLKQRDQYAAQRIIKCKKANPDKIIICMIGEYHLADEHLPRSLSITSSQEQIKLKQLRILTNVDKYFFNLPVNKPSMTTEYLYLRDNIFCIMNSPPWMKWQSYTLWEELRDISDEEYEDDEDDFDLYTEQSFDIDYQFFMMLKSLVKFLNIDIDEGRLSAFSVHTYIQENLVEQLIDDSMTNSNLTKIAIERANLDGMYLFSKNNTILMSKISINNISEAIGQFLHLQLSKVFENDLNHIDAFYTRILRNAAGMISAKILNPRRKCLTLFHYKKYLDNNFKKKLSGHPKHMRQASSAILKHHNWMKNIHQKHHNKFLSAPKSIYELDSELNFEISRSIGLMIGNKLYTNVMSNKTTASSIKEFYTKDISSFEGKWEIFSQVYIETLLK